MSGDDLTEPYTTLSEQEKRWTITLTSMVTFISPVSANIYFPAMNQLAQDLGVSTTMINLSITTFMVVQGIAPLFVASLSDTYGRRPAIIVSLVIYLAVNIGLACQNSFQALMVLRCLQSLGSSIAAVVAASVAVDVVPRAERGRYMIYSTLGVTLGLALGPIIGGVLTQFFGWRSTFWFLVVFSGVMIVLLLLFVPETCRMVVGNGSISAPTWNQPVMEYIRRRAEQADTEVEDREEKLQMMSAKKRPRPLESVRLACQKENFAVISFVSLLFCGYTAVLSTLPSQLEAKYQFNALQIGLCYIPYGLGSLTSRWTVGKLIDWNFRRHAERCGVEVEKNRQAQLIDMPLEKVRLEITFPVLYACCVFIAGYGWLMNFKTHLSGPLVMLFFMAHLTSGATGTLITLLVDCNVTTPAAATAANNAFRCLLGAGSVAGAIPLIKVISIGWTATLIAGIWLLFSPILWLVFVYGHQYRKDKLKEKDFKQGV
ncbi:major facilitator superfamily domain-containing protein [Aspergillus taichungensis]|uniref:Major facilitator superfamily domain-containing protein n=1 Tax=Aspergillus taichungensis TaxID=482145 RepID=A0A2J5I6I1_9EURO|nr:major facilitator superfamily domain-containing protein [Aspergillus taichungensis]